MPFIEIETARGARRIGDGQPCYVIAEMSANHGGELSRALEIVRAAAEAGADCIKLQTYTADTLTLDSRADCFLIKDGLWKGENLHALYARAYTPWEWHPRLKEEAEACGIDFLSTPFDPTAVDFLEGLGAEFYKVASFEIVDIPLLERAARTGKPIILSTGMASEDEIDLAARTVRAHRGARAGAGPGAGAGAGAGRNQGAGAGAPDNLILLKCTSAYPADPDEMNLRTIPYLKERFGAACGLSDHSREALPACLAVALGASVIEKHLCLSRGIPTPDAAFSTEPAEFAELVRRVRETERALGRPTFEPTPGEAVSRLHRKSVFVARAVRRGERFTERNVRVVRPADGLPPKDYASVLGRAAARDLAPGTPLSRADVAWDG